MKILECQKFYKKLMEKEFDNQYIKYYCIENDIKLIK